VGPGRHPHYPRATLAAPLHSRAVGSNRRAPWLDTSQVFADTRRIDLFDDPAWETTRRTGSRDAVGVGDRPGRASWLGALRSARTALSLHKRGAHSQKPG